MPTVADRIPDVPLTSVMSAFVGRDTLSNQELYDQLSLDLDLPAVYTEERVPVGKSEATHNLYQRKVRWHQQTLRRIGAIERMDRGRWRLTAKARSELTPAPKRQVLLAFSTDLGVALWGHAEDVFGSLQEQITLAFTSPPFPLAKQRQYGNVEQSQYVDWLCKMMEPIVKQLRRGGNLVLNLSNDIFTPGLPSRSLYLERLTLAMCDRLGLSLMDRFIWDSPSKPPGPVQWASLKRVQCNVGYEFALWFTNEPARVIADNRRCLQPHSGGHKRLLAQGGESRSGVFAGGAYRLRPGSFGQETDGTIARNVLRIGHRDRDQDAARAFADAHCLPHHPALMPTRLAEFFVDFLSERDDLVVDPFGGWATTARAAENKGRRWLVTERCREYIASAAERFRNCSGFDAP